MDHDLIKGSKMWAKETIGGIVAFCESTNYPEATHREIDFIPSSHHWLILSSLIHPQIDPAIPELSGLYVPDGSFRTGLIILSKDKDDTYRAFFQIDEAGYVKWRGVSSYSIFKDDCNPIYIEDLITTVTHLGQPFNYEGFSLTVDILNADVVLDISKFRLSPKAAQEMAAATTGIQFSPLEDVSAPSWELLFPRRLGSKMDELMNPKNLAPDRAPELVPLHYSPGPVASQV